MKGFGIVRVLIVMMVAPTVRGFAASTRTLSFVRSSAASSSEPATRTPTWWPQSSRAQLPADRFSNHAEDLRRFASTSRQNFYNEVEDKGNFEDTSDKPRQSSSPLSGRANTSNSGKKAYTITWLTNDDETDRDQNSTISFQVYHGETLRTAALRRGIVSPHNGRANVINCRGLGTCGTCAVDIVQGMEHLHPPNRNNVETMRFNVPPHNFHSESNQSLRLACQIQVHGDVTVQKRTGFWGQQASIQSDLSIPTKPFGDLEYILDRKSPAALNPKKDNNDGKEKES